LTESPPATPPVNSRSKSFDIQTRNNALVLLGELLNDEKHLSAILIIKRESRELNSLVKEISDTAGKGAELVESEAKQDALKLSDNGLPPGEKATRDAISKTKEHQLLHSKGAEFEFRLLLTQVEALNYGAHLARIIADNEPQSERAEQFYQLSTHLTRLYDQNTSMVRKK